MVRGAKFVPVRVEGQERRGIVFAAMIALLRNWCLEVFERMKTICQRWLTLLLLW